MLKIPSSDVLALRQNHNNANISCLFDLSCFAVCEMWHVVTRHMTCASPAVSTQFKVTPAVDLAESIRLSDSDNETCMRLDVGQVYSQETRKWTRPIADRCWLPGVTVETSGGGGTGSFTVTVTVAGRHITCDRHSLEVFMKHTDHQDCGLRGSFHRCPLTSAGVSNDQLTRCVASCQCRVAKCNSPTVRFVTRREDAVVCEISVQ